MLIVIPWETIKKITRKYIVKELKRKKWYTRNLLLNYYPLNTKEGSNRVTTEQKRCETYVKQIEKSQK